MASFSRVADGLMMEYHSTGRDEQAATKDGI